MCLLDVYQSFTIAGGFIFIPHANTIQADYGKAQFYLKKPTLINKNTAFQTETVPYQNLPINTETPDRYQTVTDPLPPCTITVFNLAFFPFFILLTRAKKTVSTGAPPMCWHWSFYLPPCGVLERTAGGCQKLLVDRTLRDGEALQYSQMKRQRNPNTTQIPSVPSVMCNHSVGIRFCQ